VTPKPAVGRSRRVAAPPQVAGTALAGAGAAATLAVWGAGIALWLADDPERRIRDDGGGA
jgi:hypothetical protein